MTAALARIPGQKVGSATVWQLVERAQAGDRQAYGDLYARYHETVFRFVYFRTGSRPLAEDLTQETFTRAMRRIGGFTWQGRDIGAWFVTIARNLVADHYKSARHRLEAAYPGPTEGDREDGTPEGDIETTVVGRATSALLRAAVDRLGDEQRTCIELRFFRDMTVAETARAMRKNEGAIKALTYRAVRALARMPDVTLCR